MASQYPHLGRVADTLERIAARHAALAALHAAQVAQAAKNRPPAPGTPGPAREEGNPQ